MAEVCGKQIWKKGGGLIIDGHCGLTKNHNEKCSLVNTAKAEAERMSTKQLDLDLTEHWKPCRDLPGGDSPVTLPGGDEELPEHLIADEI